MSVASRLSLAVEVSWRRCEIAVATRSPEIPDAIKRHAKLVAMQRARKEIEAAINETCTAFADDHAWAIRYMERLGEALSCPLHRRLADIEREIEAAIAVKQP